MDSEKESKAVALQDNEVVAYEASFEGPIPPPSLLKDYEQASPGAAERILKMAEEQANHRQKLEEKIVSASIENERKGLNYGLVLSLVLMILGFILIIKNKDAAGYLAFFAPVVLRAGSYIISKQEESKDK